MKAILLNGFGSVDHLELREIDTPVVPEQEVLVEVRAIGLNPVDVTTRAWNWLSPELKDADPIILGWDISGIVRESRSSLFQNGDNVFGMIRFPGHGKAYAEYVAAPGNQLALKPANISHQEAAAGCLAALTAYQSLHTHYQVKAGQRILVQAASGGVGHYAVQLAKQAGAYVIGTSSEANRDFVLSLGADEHIDYHNVRFEEVTSDIDFVLETIGGKQIERSLDVIKKGGTLISISSGISQAAALKARSKGIHAFTTLVESNGPDMQQLAKLFSTGALRSHISGVFPFEEMGRAHLELEKGRTRGKIVVSLFNK